MHGEENNRFVIFSALRKLSHSPAIAASFRLGGKEKGGELADKREGGGCFVPRRKIGARPLLHPGRLDGEMRDRRRQHSFTMQEQLCAPDDFLLPPIPSLTPSSASNQWLPPPSHLKGMESALPSFLCTEQNLQMEGGGLLGLPQTLLRCSHHQD